MFLLIVFLLEPFFKGISVEEGPAPAAAPVLVAVVVPAPGLAWDRVARTWL
jgi:hypothetical protein